MNRTLLEKARDLMKKGGMPQKVSGDAINNAAHLYRRKSSQVMNMKPAFKIFFGKVTTLSWVEAFDCQVYSHI